jgi:hypothetical protein
MVARRWYQHPAVVVGSLLLCFPVGFVLVFLTAWSARTKLLAAGAGTLLAVMLAIASAAAPAAPRVSAGGVAEGAVAAPTTVPSTATSTTIASTTTTSTTAPTTTTTAPVPPPSPPPTTPPRPVAQVPPPTKAPAAPRTTAASAASGCNANYSGCVPIASDVDCAGGDNNGPAWVTGPVRVLGTDVYGLDADHDGLGCE